MKTVKLPEELFESLVFYTEQRDARLARIARNVAARGAYIEETEDARGRVRRRVVELREGR